MSTIVNKIDPNGGVGATDPMVPDNSTDRVDRSDQAAAGLVFPVAVQSDIEDHAFSETTKEVGGILIGKLVDDRAEITGSIPALKAQGSATNVTFTHDVWDDVLDRVDSDFPGDQIVGWYHTHPGFGLFLSEYDLFIQRSFFSDERMVALVVDPLAGNAGWFGWRDGDVTKTATFGTEHAAVNRQDVAATIKTRKSRGRAVLYGAAIALIGGIAGYVVATTAVDSSTELDAAAQTIAEQRAEIYALSVAPEGAADTSPRAAQLGSATGTVIYTVQPGDGWWTIAESFYGEGDQFVALRRANEKKSLDPGDQVRIPGITLEN